MASAGCRCIPAHHRPRVYSCPPPPRRFRHCGRMRPALAAWLALGLLVGMGAEEMCGDPPSAPSRSIPAPQLSPEERLSPHMPEALRCDACHAIAFQVGIGDTAPKTGGESPPGMLQPGTCCQIPCGTTRKPFGASEALTATHGLTTPCKSASVPELQGRGCRPCAPSGAGSWGHRHPQCPVSALFHPRSRSSCAGRRGRGAGRH